MNEIKQAMLSPKELEVISQKILAKATECGVDQAEVGVNAAKGYTVKAHDGDVETVEYNQDKSIDISVYFGNKTGSASISDVRDQAISDAVEAACHIAKFTDPDPAAGLAEKDELAFDYPQLDTSHVWQLGVEEAIKMAVQCEKEALAVDKRIMSAEEASVSTEEGHYIYANTRGFTGVFPYSRHEISCVLVAKEQSGMQRDYSYTVACDPSQLKSVTSVAKEAAARTVKRLGARRIKTCKTPVIFLAEEARGLFGHFAAAISGGSIYRRSSFLLDKIDEKIFPDFVHIQEQPHLKAGLCSAPFDNDGVRTRDNIFVENGVLQTYALGVYSARKLKLKTTGNAGGTHNLIIQTSNQTFSDLLKAMGTGFLVTELIGQGINLVTGDYSRGAGGFWVENGEIQYPVHEVTVAGNLRDMYANIVGIANDVDTRGNVRTGSVFISEMTVAGD